MHKSSKPLFTNVYRQATSFASVDTRVAGEISYSKLCTCDVWRFIAYHSAVANAILSIRGYRPRLYLWSLKASTAIVAAQPRLSLYRIAGLWT